MKANTHLKVLGWHQLFIFGHFTSIGAVPGTIQCILELCLLEYYPALILSWWVCYQQLIHISVHLLRCSDMFCCKTPGILAFWKQHITSHRNVGKTEGSSKRQSSTAWIFAVIPFHSIPFNSSKKHLRCVPERHKSQVRFNDCINFQQTCLFGVFLLFNAIYFFYFHLAPVVSQLFLIPPFVPHHWQKSPRTDLTGPLP